ncbi:carboxymuconolactone decarboxylase family protein [Dokdonella soli]|uniref:Peroxidase-related enzyme n=1 Tax=Dokdonella soli TaxID=529810 RepID=A0ABN1IDR7_9GAMM
MSRMPLVTPDAAQGEAAKLLERTQQQLGRIPNLYAAMANAPAALAGYLDFRAALVRGTLSTRLREQLALVVAEANGCEYCVSAHSFRGSKLGLSEPELVATRNAQSADPATAAALRFAVEVVATHGRVSDAALAAVRAASHDDKAIGEIVAHVALNTFSNYFNHVATPELDFPRVAVGHEE